MIFQCHSPIQLGQDYLSHGGLVLKMELNHSDTVEVAWCKGIYLLARSTWIYGRWLTSEVQFEGGNHQQRFYPLNTQIHSLSEGWCTVVCNWSPIWKNIINLWLGEERNELIKAFTLCATIFSTSCLSLSYGSMARYVMVLKRMVTFSCGSKTSVEP